MLKQLMVIVLAAFALQACAYNVNQRPEEKPTSTYSTAKDAVFNIHRRVPDFVMECTPRFEAEAFAETTDRGDRWKEFRKTELGDCKSSKVTYQDGRPVPKKGG